MTSATARLVGADPNQVIDHFFQRFRPQFQHRDASGTFHYLVRENFLPLPFSVNLTLIAQFDWGDKHRGIQLTLIAIGNRKLFRDESNVVAAEEKALEGVKDYFFAQEKAHQFRISRPEE